MVVSIVLFRSHPYQPDHRAVAAMSFLHHPLPQNLLISPSFLYEDSRDLIDAREELAMIVLFDEQIKGELRGLLLSKEEGAAR